MYAELKKFESLAKLNGLEIINLGTGMGYYDFNYNKLPVNAFNFALPQQNLYFDYQLLRTYSDLMRRNCIVCVVLPYFIFCADCLKDVMKKYERYYSLLPREIVEPYCCVPYDNSILKDRENTAQEKILKYVLNEDEMALQSQKALEHWKDELGIISYETGEVSLHTRNEIGKTQKWLTKILEYCLEMQFRPVIIVPPMSRTLLDKIGLLFRKLNFYDIVEKVVPKDIQLLDYTESEFFCNPTLYGWPGFLAESASEIFTKDVLQKIRIL